MPMNATIENDAARAKERNWTSPVLSGGSPIAAALRRSLAIGLVALAGLSTMHCGGEEGEETVQAPFCESNPCSSSATCSESTRSCTCAVGLSGDGLSCNRPLPTLHGLAVVADFIDSRLEDYAGPGFRSVGEIESQLAQMSEHWGWLSAGSQEFSWTVIRVQLPVALTPNAYAGWPDFRRDVVLRARARLGSSVSQYDGDHDGVLDAVWIIPAAPDSPDQFPYLGGGASRNANAGVFVDSQDSESARRRATGNFNHEVGHLRGLPDVYGKYDTLDFLSLMSFSWYDPPVGFSAMGRLWLDWLDVREVRGDATITLPPAETHLTAALIPGVRPSEYVLIEYRKKPTSGFGSGSGIPSYDGLAIYHVYEASGSNAELPPLVRLEPADGALALTGNPDGSDFWSPDNPGMLDAYRGRSYYNGEEFVVVSNIARSNGGMRFDVHATALAPPAANNLVTNPGFESGASGWTTGGWNESAARFRWEAGGGRRGTGCVSIEATGTGVDASWQRTLNGLTPGATYELRGWIKGANIRAWNPPDAFVGANLSVFGPDRSTSTDGKGTFDWKEFRLSFTAQSGSVTLACRLGHNMSLMTGKAWFDDLSVVRLAHVPRTIRGTGGVPPY